MKLAEVTRPGSEDGHGIHFPMTFKNTSVRVTVVREALQALNSSLAPTDYMGRFAAYRKVFELIARYKFEKDARINTIKVVVDDLAGVGVI